MASHLRCLLFGENGDFRRRVLARIGDLYKTGVCKVGYPVLSAKSLFTKAELHSLQTDFAKQVGERYGLERGVEGSERSHLSEQQFKTKTALEVVDKLLKRRTRFKRDVLWLETTGTLTDK